jgi:hypothetical protein
MTSTGENNTMAHYIIAEYANNNDAWEFVSSVGETHEDTWTTMMPYNYKGDDHKEPVKFETKVAAQRILDALKAARLSEWEKNRYYYVQYGRKKPQWKIYKVEV